MHALTTNTRALSLSLVPIKAKSKKKPHSVLCLEIFPTIDAVLAEVVEMVDPPV
jgi:hypothetical protein